MSLIMALNTVIGILKKTHIEGADAEDFAEAIKLLIRAVQSLEAAKKVEERKADDQNCDEQG